MTRRCQSRHLLLALALIMAGACARGTTSGGGWLVAQDGINKANFGFNATRCGDVLEGNINYHDRSAAGFAPKGGVKVNGPVSEVRLCPVWSTNAECAVCPERTGTAFLAKFAYRSTNPNLPGQGDIVACVVNAEDNVPDEVAFWIESGPFEGYRNSGPLQGGSLEQAACPVVEAQ